MTIDYVAVALAAVAAWLVGAVWYGVLGKPWRAAAGLSLEGAFRLPVGPMVVSFVAEAIMAFMLAGLIAHFGTPTIVSGLIVASHCWLAFVATTIVVNNAYPGRKLILSIIDGGHWLLALLAEGAVIGAFG